MNIMPIEAELMSMCISLIPALDNPNTCDITVVTDSIYTARKILESKMSPFQKSILPIAIQIKAFLSRSNRNAIHFWQCPKKAEWPQHKLVDDQVKASNGTPTCPSKNSHLFSQKKECDNILKEW